MTSYQSVRNVPELGFSLTRCDTKLSCNDAWGQKKLHAFLERPEAADVVIGIEIEYVETRIIEKRKFLRLLTTLPFLAELSLPYNSLSRSDVRLLSQLPALRDVHLIGNDGPNRPLDTFIPLVAKVAYLNVLGDVEMTDAFAEAVRTSTTIQRLYVKSTTYHRGFEVLAKCVKYLEVDLPGTMTAFFNAAVGGVLEKLFLWAPDIDYQAIPQFIRATRRHLTHFSMYYTYLDGEETKSIEAMRHYGSNLYLSWNFVSPEMMFNAKLECIERMKVLAFICGMRDGAKTSLGRFFQRDGDDAILHRIWLMFVL